MTKELFVSGTLMKGLELNKNLQGSEFMGAFTTEPCYRLYSINDVHPGMYEVEDGGIAVAGEMYRMSDEIWQKVEEGEPPHLYCGPVKLNNGQVVDGILFPQEIAETHHKDISEFGDWRRYMTTKK
jgi:gamma-glutamylaminecyclotransferase